MRLPPALVLLALLLAGCAAPQAPPPAMETPAAPRATEAALVQESCMVLEVIVSLSEDAVRQAIPPHFEPVSENGVVLAALGGASCGEAGGGRAFFAIPVDPLDDALRDEGVSRYYYEPDHAALPGGALADALAEAGLVVPVLAGLDVAAGPTGVTLRSEGPNATFSARTATGVLPGSSPSPDVFREYFPAPGGYGYFQAAYGETEAYSALTAATYEAGEGTAARRLAGASGAGGAVALAGLTFEDARVGFVPMP